jgi:hypothetical protein
MYVKDKLVQTTESRSMSEKITLKSITIIQLCSGRMAGLKLQSS